MNRYAKVVRNLPAILFGHSVPYLLGAGTQLREIRPWNDGYRFEANTGEDWVDLVTDKDLPAFTDRGRAKRADDDLPIHPALGRGRPKAERTKVRGVRMTDNEWEWLAKQAAKLSLTASEFVRKSLKERGMP